MTYESLQAEFRLRPIKTDEDYKAAVALWRSIDFCNGPIKYEHIDEVSDYCGVLSMLLAMYETEQLAVDYEDEDEEDE